MGEAILTGQRKLRHCLHAAALAPAQTALFCDIDGTIAPIARVPEEASVPPVFQHALRALAQRLGLLAFVTGRDLEGGRRMVAVDGAVYVGTHGIQIEMPDGTRHIDPAAAKWNPAVREVFAMARALPLDDLGIVLEDKHTMFALHYRPATDRQRARATIERSVIPAARARGLRVNTGHLAYEVGPPLATTKGTATRRLLATGDYRVALFLGDDLTDCDGFTAVRAWAAEGFAERRTGLAVAIVTDETPAAVTDSSDIWVAGTPGALEVLDRLLAAVMESG